MNFEEPAPATSNNARITVVIEPTITDAQQRPKEIIVRPIRRAGARFFDDQLNAFERMATVLRRSVLQAVRPYFLNLNDNQIKQRVRGNLIMQNFGNGRAIRDSTTLNRIDEFAFEELFQRPITAGSNPDLSIYDVYWSFWINPASYIIGGNQTFKPGKLKGINNWNKKPIRHEDEIGCAALAVCDAIEYDRKRYTKQHPWYTVVKFAKWVMEVQKELDFVNPLAVSIEEMKNVVQVFPEYQLNIFFNTHIARGISFTGSEFNPLEPKYLNILYDQNHYVRITGLLSFARSLKSHTKACPKCCTFYFENSI
jgi:hypothetical protein